MENGIYFNMSEDYYFAENRLSSSGIREILSSPAEYWFNSNYNPLREERKSESMQDGKIYHAYILENKDFNSRYKIVPEEISNMNKNSSQYKMWAALQNLPLVSYKKFKEMERIYNYLNSDGQIFDSNILKDGYSEVSIFWEYRGVKLKSRIDYLKLKQFLDLKTFVRSSSEDLDIYVAKYFYTRKVYIQIILYLMAIEYARQFNPRQVFGNTDQLDFFLRWRDYGNDMPLILFLNRKLPQFRLKTFNKEQCPDLYRLGKSQIDKAIDIYKQYQEKNGMNYAWLEDVNLEKLSFVDEDFPQKFYDILGVEDE